MRPAGFSALRMSPPEIAILLAYFGALCVLAVYGLHRYALVYLYFRCKSRRARPARRWKEWPSVTVQLPIFNEKYVVRRLIDAVASLDYPRDRLEIQVLDDSTDETREIAAEAAARWRSRGVDVVHVHRADRRGYKAGALAEGLRRARGEFVAVFDADFVPPRDYLRRTLPFFAHRRVGLVQTRWGHLNRDYSLLTRAQAILLDGHFVLEHGARFRGRRFFNFNGTAGIWRRSCIEDAGGWQYDTLTEDLDLSYRAQMRGWRFVYVPEIVAPAELPAEMNAFKVQQARWAEGAIQTCRKILPALLRSSLPFRIKLEAAIHLTGNLAYGLMVVVAALMFPAFLVRADHGGAFGFFFDVSLFLAASASVVSFYVLSQREAYPDWRRRLRELPLVLAVGIGLSVNNAAAVLRGLLRRGGEFERTPKHGLATRADGWLGRSYAGRKTMLAAVEILYGLAFVAAIAVAVDRHLWVSAAFFSLFAFGFLYVGVLSVGQRAIEGWLRRPSASPVPSS
jgi:cellulose synthase/poly-beta-1,6-N-acetylglucosamine synthase-like glycosyltransferase